MSAILAQRLSLAGRRILSDRRATDVPDGLAGALLRVRGDYSSIQHLFYLIYLGDQKWIGVAGDGDNACYEHFLWWKGQLTITNDGYGSCEVALKDALNREVMS